MFPLLSRAEKASEECVFTIRGMFLCKPQRSACLPLGAWLYPAGCKTVLDLGCGYGLYLLELRANNFYAVGFDGELVASVKG